MEFDEMKKIWDSQTNQVLFAIDEEALHRRIRSKKRKAGHIASFTEWLLVSTNLVAAVLVVATELSVGRQVISFYLMTAWMALTAGYVVFHRIRRLRETTRFDRTLSGDLDHALANARYQVRISGLMRWNIIPISVFVLMAFWERGTSLWIVGSVILLLALAHIGGGWEHRIYENREKELEGLLAKLKES